MGPVKYNRLLPGTFGHTDAINMVFGRLIDSSTIPLVAVNGGQFLAERHLYNQRVMEKAKQYLKLAEENSLHNMESFQSFVKGVKSDVIKDIFAAGLKEAFNQRETAFWQDYFKYDSEFHALFPTYQMACANYNIARNYYDSLFDKRAERLNNTQLQTRYFLNPLVTLKNGTNVKIKVQPVENFYQEQVFFGVQSLGGSPAHAYDAKVSNAVLSPGQEQSKRFKIQVLRMANK